jgi:hypothetical protein
MEAGGREAPVGRICLFHSLRRSRSTALGQRPWVRGGSRRHVPQPARRGGGCLPALSLSKGQPLILVWRHLVLERENAIVGSPQCPSIFCVKVKTGFSLTNNGTMRESHRIVKVEKT